MYKQNVEIETYEGDTVTCNIESVGKRAGCYLYYFRCAGCKNQSIADDEGTVYSCNNLCEFSDKNDEKIYCKNYVKER